MTYDQWEAAEGISGVSREAYYAERAWDAAIAQRLTKFDIDAAGAVWAAVASSPRLIGKLEGDVITEIANGAEKAARVAVLLAREQGLDEGEKRADPKAVNAELLLMLKEAVSYIEHEHANRGKVTTDAQWDANVAEFRASPAAEISIGRSAVPKATIRIGAARVLIERIEGSL